MGETTKSMSKTVEFNSNGDRFDMSRFITECDAAVSGMSPEDTSSACACCSHDNTPIPASTTSEVTQKLSIPVAEGVDPITYSPFEEVLEELKAGKMILVTDDPARENEADLVCAGEFASPENINFMATHARGLICVPMSAERIAKLSIPMQTAHNTEKHHTAFTVSVDAKDGITTGISAFERSITTMKLADPSATQNDFVQPGHSFPLRALAGGVLRRAGHTEATVDLMEICGLEPVGVCCEIMKDDGTMARLGDLGTFQKTHQLKACSIDQIIDYRIRTEQRDTATTLVVREEVIKLPTRYGNFTCYSYHSSLDGQTHLALVHGDVDLSQPVLCRLHSECLTGDVFGSRRCDCGSQLDLAMKQIAEENGILLYMRQEGRGIGLAAKLRAYKLQEQGLDTVDANLHLGFAADLRDYRPAAQMLLDVGAKTLRLMTNNPAKIEGLESCGITIAEQVPLASCPHEDNIAYLTTKKERMGHTF